MYLKKIITFSLVAILSLSLLVNFNEKGSAAPLEIPGVKAQLDLNELKNMGMTLQAAPELPDQAAEAAAVKSANNKFSGIVGNSEPVNVDYVLLTSRDGFFADDALEKNPALKNGLNNSPVFIVTYEGTVPSSTDRTHSELVVVVDAISGVALYAVSYR